MQQRRGEPGRPLPETWGDPAGGSGARRRREEELASKPVVVHAWLAGLLTTSEAVVLGSLDPDPAVRVWASELFTARLRDPASIVRGVTLA